MHALVSVLLAQGHKVSVVAPQVGCEPAHPCADAGVRLYLHSSFRESGWSALVEPRLMLRKLERFLDSIYRRDKPDIVLAFNIFYVAASKRACPQIPVGYLSGGAIRDWYSWLSGRASRLGRLAWYMRTYQSERIEREALERAEANFPEAKRLRDRLQQLHPGIRAKYILWPTPVDKERFKPDAVLREKIRRELGIAAEEKLLLCLGRLHWNKNFRVVIEALNTITRRDFQLLIIGRGVDLVNLQELAAKGPHGDRTTFIAASQDMEKIYTAADIFLHPALDEPYGLVVQEALSSGLACILSGPEHIGFSEHLSDEVNALLADPRDVSAWATKLERLMADRPLRLRLGASARAFIEARPGWPELTQILLRELSKNAANHT